MARYKALLGKLNGWLANSTSAAPTGGDFYRTAPGQGAPQKYPEFICVPFPQRSSTGALPQFPEVAVLVVSVKAPDATGDAGARQPAQSVKQPSSFTSERVDMLESLAELIGTMLITSSALGKPRGLWDNRV